MDALISPEPASTVPIHRPWRRERKEETTVAGSDPPPRNDPSLALFFVPVSPVDDSNVVDDVVTMELGIDEDRHSTSPAHATTTRAQPASNKHQGLCLASLPRPDFYSGANSSILCTMVTCILEEGLTDRKQQVSELAG
jgi:hypothetical protein